MSIQNEALMALIRNRLMQDSRIACAAIDVRCAEGYVHLIGMVDTPEQKEVAVALVTGLVGVRKVIDELGVRMPVAEAAAVKGDWAAV